MVLVVANGQPPTSSLLHRLAKQHRDIIAVDGGLHVCIECGITPTMMIGDFDSVSDETREHYNDIFQLHTPDQNKSDLEKTLDYLFQQGHQQILVCGALGKRVDHTMTNICLLCRYPGKVTFETETEVCFALCKESIIECHEGQTLSLIPMSSEVTGVVTKGLKWELQGAVLNKFFFSISNISLGSSVSITFQTGDLIACLLTP